ncbi:hypothetical protein [Mesorhizobium sp. M0778]|uniref:hypothetical protein n=1 Tax=Mesorhizobium sp. M0778 TaxID=2956999 RepID=UPI00333A84BF
MKKQRIVLLAAVLASAFGFFLLILILQMVSFLVTRHAQAGWIAQRHAEFFFASETPTT